MYRTRIKGWKSSKTRTACSGTLSDWMLDQVQHDGVLYISMGERGKDFLMRREIREFKLQLMLQTGRLPQASHWGAKFKLPAMPVVGDSRANGEVAHGCAVDESKDGHPVHKEPPEPVLA